MEYVPAGIPENPVADADPPETVGVAQRFPPFQKRDTVPVAPPPMVAVQVVFWAPYVIGFGAQDRDTDGVAALTTTD